MFPKLAPVWKPALLASGVATAATLLLVAPTLAPRTPAPVAFARVEEALSSVQTATWTSTFTTTVRFAGTRSRPAKPFQSVSVYQNFLQTNPARTASVLSTSTQGGLPTPRTDVSKTVGDGIYTITVNSYPNKPSKRIEYYRMGSDNSRGRTPQERVIRSVLFPRNPTELSPTEHTRKQRFATIVERSTAWASTPDKLQGRDVLRFERTTTRTVLASPKYKRPESRTQALTQVWVDPQTYRIIRREQFSLPKEGGKLSWHTVEENFNYNASVPAGTFDVPRPPEGMWFRFTDFTERNSERWRVRPEENWQIEQLIRNVASAWNRGDERTFLSLFDFEATARNGQAISGIPITSEAERQRKHWLGRIRNQTPYRTWQVNSIGGLESGMPWHMYKLDKPTDPFPPRDLDTRRAIRFIPSARGKAVLKQGSPAVPVQTTFGVTRSDDGKFRLTDLNMFTYDGKRWSSPELRASAKLAKKPSR